MFFCFVQTSLFTEVLLTWILVIEMKEQPYQHFFSPCRCNWKFLIHFCICVNVGKIFNTHLARRVLAYHHFLSSILACVMTNVLKKQQHLCKNIEHLANFGLWKLNSDDRYNKFATCLLRGITRNFFYKGITCITKFKLGLRIVVKKFNKFQMICTSRTKCY